MCQSALRSANVHMVGMFLYYPHMNESLLVGVVDCRNLGLTKIPEGIPFDTVEL